MKSVGVQCDLKKKIVNVQTARNENFVTFEEYKSTKNHFQSKINQLQSLLEQKDSKINQLMILLEKQPFIHLSRIDENFSDVQSSNQSIKEGIELQIEDESDSNLNGDNHKNGLNACKEFKYRSKYVENIQVRHEEIRKYTCNYCDEKFNCKDYLTNHRKIMHGTSDRIFKCEICGREFRNWGNFSRHLRIHSNKQLLFNCAICNAAFSQKYLMRSHVKKVHPEQISLISKKLIVRKSSVEQVEKQNNSINVVDFVKESAVKEEKCYSCKVCAKDFTNYGNFRRHLRTHSGLKPLECEKCGMGFVRKFRLEQHFNEVHKNEVAGPEIKSN